MHDVFLFVFEKCLVVVRFAAVSFFFFACMWERVLGRSLSVTFLSFFFVGGGGWRLRTCVCACVSPVQSSLVLSSPAVGWLVGWFGSGLLELGCYHLLAAGTELAVYYCVCAFFPPFYSLFFFRLCVGCCVDGWMDVCVQFVCVQACVQVCVSNYGTSVRLHGACVPSASGACARSCPFLASLRFSVVC